MRRLGLSIWVATIETPVPGFHLCGMVKARSEDWFLSDRKLTLNVERVRVGVRATNSPGEEVLSTLLDILLPLVNFTDLIIGKATKNESSCHGGWMPAYPTFLNPAFSSRRIAFWTA